MMNFYIFIFTISALICNVVAETTTEPIQDSTLLKTFQVEHAIIPNTFTPRGVIEISIDDQGNLESTFRKTAESSLSNDELNGIDAIIANNGYYKVRVQDDTTGASVLASVPGCDVKRANFREDIGIVLGNTGSLISLSYKPLVSPLAPQCHELQPFVLAETEPQQQYDFKTKVSLSGATPGIVIPAVLPNSRPPVGYDWIKRSQQPKNNMPTTAGGGGDGVVVDSPKMGESGEAGSEDAFFDPLQGEKPQQQSFLRRYWYIILPIVIMTFMAPEEPAPNQSRNGSAGGSGSAAAAAAAVGNVATGVGGNVGSKSAATTGMKQRRGKRG